MIKHQKMQVLIVDDQAMFRDATAFEFECRGFQPTLAENGQIGFQLASNHTFDLIISDIRMPIWDGPRFLSELRKEHKQAPPFVFMSGFSDLTETEAFEMGADAFIAKPINVNVLEKLMSYVMLDPSKKWGRVPDPTHYQVTGTFEDLNTLSSQKAISLGRGGFYLEGFEELRNAKIGELINFNFQFLSSTIESLSGVAALRWIDSDDIGGDIKVGLEILSLAESCRESVVNFIISRQIVPFIPCMRPGKLSSLK